MNLSRVGVSRGGEAMTPIASLSSAPRVLPSSLQSLRENTPQPVERLLRGRPVVSLTLLPRRTRVTRRILPTTRAPTPRPRAAKVRGDNDAYSPTPHLQNQVQPHTPPNDEPFKQDREKRELGSNIPWGVGKIVEVMFLWLICFVLFRSSIWHMGLWLLGISSEAELSASGQAAFTLFLDFAMLWATIGILWKSLQQFRPFKDKVIFPRRFRGKWWITLIIACCCIPIVDWLGTHMTIWFPENLDLPTNNVVVQLSRGDLVPNLLYFILLSVCAPLWEELMFRGFLLQSLGKFLPASGAILLSSAIFAVMHGNLRQFLPLWVLGVIIGKAFVHTRNLIPAILLHSMYNCYVFAHVLFGG